MAASQDDCYNWEYALVPRTFQLRTMTYKLLLVRGKIFVQARDLIQSDDIENSYDSAGHWSSAATTSKRKDWHDSSYKRYEDFEEYKLQGRSVTIELLQGVNETIQAEVETVYGTGNHFIMPACRYHYPAVSGDRKFLP